MLREVFRKTAAGHAEVRGRALGLDARTRGLLILVNGELTVAELAARVGFEPYQALVKMVGAGLLEQVAAVPRARPVAPHYGPDAIRMAAPLREAANAAQFALALAALKDTLSVHMGRKLADRLSREIAHGP